jgi:N-acetylmuramoyl-L-alanine amidase
VIHAFLAASLLAAQPTRLQIRTSAGVTSIALIQIHGDGPFVSLDALARGLGGSVDRADAWITLQIGAGRFRFLAGTPLVQDGAGMSGLPAASRARGDSLFVPLAFVSEVLAAPSRQGWTYTPATATLEERWHYVTIDPGHGGHDTGNPGKFFPRGMTEKDVTLAVGLLVAADLEQMRQMRIKVNLTRKTDTLINLEQRAPRYCQRSCDLFVSIHVNSLDPRPGYTNVRGFETYFLSEARTEDAVRVARMENESVRFDTPAAANDTGNKLDFMFKDLQTAEFLRQSQQAAAMIQSSLLEVQDGGSKGVKQTGFAVLRTATRPAVLIEMGYATNKEDAALMTSPAGQRKLAASIARAIVAALKQFDKETAGAGGAP